MSNTITRPNMLRVLAGPYGQQEVLMDNIRLKNEKEDPAVKFRITYQVNTPNGSHPRYTETFLTTEQADAVCSFMENWSGSMTIKTGAQGQDLLHLQMDTIMEKVTNATGEVIDVNMITAMRLCIECPAPDPKKKPYLSITTVNFATADIIINYLDRWLEENGYLSEASEVEEQATLG